jgi:hypothetical protein
VSPQVAPLSRAVDRLRAAALIDSTRRYLGTDGFTLVQALDTVCAALLRGAGINDTAARAILAALWDHPIGTADAFVPPRTPRRTEQEREFLRELGQRVHVVRRARRRSSSDLCRMLDLRSVELHDLEHGEATPTALLLYRLAAVLQVPLPMLVDPNATPLKVLRLLGSGGL